MTEPWEVEAFDKCPACLHAKGEFGTIRYVAAVPRGVRRCWYAPWRKVVREATPAKMAATCKICGYVYEWRPGTKPTAPASDL